MCAPGFSRYIYGYGINDFSGAVEVFYGCQPRDDSIEIDAFVASELEDYANELDRDRMFKQLME